MKIKSLVIASALAGGLLTSASALTAAVPVKIEAPAPTRVVRPAGMPFHYSGSAVTVTLTIDATGRPSDVRVLARDPESYKDLVAAVSQWQFTPARKNGLPVSSKVELPLEIRGA